MTENQHFNFSNKVVLAPLFAVLIIWFIFWFELKFRVNLNHFGVYPRTILGLRGILFSPFIHGSIEHLYHNTIPLAVLLSALFYFYRQIALQVVLYGILLSGIFTWLVGVSSYHIGASGLIYVLVSFIFFKGIRTRYYRLIALSLVMVFIYGSLLWYIFPVKEGISWEGHLGGFLAGLLLAFLIKTPLLKPVKYEWERESYDEKQDPFLKHFDEDGNFIENLPESESKQTEDAVVNYVYKPRKEDID
ncbi:rhomboid family intramembrane serine protease [Maribacter sp. CXY002]|uniref:rhomboid family intramembrane serine protease n=1 Tax=Maribacter luteocoastalis TaxID=3407671 RepID=UPI003B67034E